MVFRLLSRGGIYIALIFGVLYQWLQKRNKDKKVTEQAPFTIETSAYDNVVDGLQAKDWRVRLWAVQSLGENPDSASIPDLLPLLNDSDADVREATALALGNCGEVAIEPLTVALQASAYEEREAAIRALAVIQSNESYQHILNALQHDDNGWVRRTAADVLGQTQNPAYVQALGEALNTEQVQAARLAMQHALAQIDTPSARKLIKTAAANEQRAALLSDEF